MRNKTEMSRLERIEEFYTIKGDGVARLRLDHAVKNKTFKANIRKLADLALENGISSNKQTETSQV